MNFVFILKCAKWRRRTDGDDVHVQLLVQVSKYWSLLHFTYHVMRGVGVGGRFGLSIELSKLALSQLCVCMHVEPLWSKRDGV